MSKKAISSPNWIPARMNPMRSPWNPPSGNWKRNWKSRKSSWRSSRRNLCRRICGFPAPMSSNAGSWPRSPATGWNVQGNCRWSVRFPRWNLKGSSWKRSSGKPTSPGLWKICGGWTAVWGQNILKRPAAILNWSPRRSRERKKNWNFSADGSRNAGSLLLPQAGSSGFSARIPGTWHGARSPRSSQPVPKSVPLPGSVLP